MSSLENLYKYFQDFEDIREELSEVLDNWDTPTIVAFGSQNAGKSTLLERLAMIPLFPKGDGLCTRMPIRIRMRTDINEKTTMRVLEVNPSISPKETVLSNEQIEANQDISKIVNEKMQELLKALKPKKQGVRTDRIIEVELRRAKLPNLDLLDIPGMVINPGLNDDPELPKQTYDLVLNTLKSLKDRAIFLAVREAGDDPQQSIVVKVLNEIPEIKAHCFGVLTKCDLMADKLVADRLQKSKDWQLGYGYFAVVNDPDYRTLKTMADHEKEYFTENQVRKEWVSKKQVGCEMILEKLNEGYHKYLKENWAYDTVEHLKKNIGALENQMNDLGPTFKSEKTINPSKQEILAFEKAINTTLEIVQKKILEMMFPMLFQSIQNQLNPIKTIFLTHQFKEEQSLLTSGKDDFFKAMAQKKHLLQQVRHIIKDQMKLFFEDYERKIKQLLEDDMVGKSIISDLRIGRFNRLIQFILKQLPIQETKQDLLNQCDQEINRWFLDHVNYENQKVKVSGFSGLFDKMINLMILGFQGIDWTFDWQTLLSNQLVLWEDSSSRQQQILKERRDRISMTKNKMFDLFGSHLKAKRIVVVEKVAGNIEKHLIYNASFQMVYCPAGEFWMGSEEHITIYGHEKPMHKVQMSKGILIGETQVTQDLWEKVMGWNPSHFKESSKLPVEYVTWYDCLLFCNQLSELEKFTPCFTLKNVEKDSNHIKKAIVEWDRNANGYRLPTEAEWEYCAKAGKDLIYSGSNNLNEVAWYNNNSKVNGNYTIHEVKTKKANAWGLYDMSGNVWEWCMDQYASSEYSKRTNGNIENPHLWNNYHCARVVRGASFRDDADDCRVASRLGVDADSRYGNQGLRLLRCEP